MTTWMPIPDFPDYEISEDGQIRSYKVSSRPRPIKQRVNLGGHLQADIVRANGTRCPMLVHRLVLMAFVGPPTPGRPICRHLDGVPTNNHVSNLRWGTYGENARDRVAHEGTKTHCKRGHPFSPENTIAQRSGRKCRTCAAQHARDYRRRLKAAADLRELMPAVKTKEASDG